MLWALTSGPPGSIFQRRYVGQYVEGKRQGEGEMRFPNGDLYTGIVSKGDLLPLITYQTYRPFLIFLKYNIFNLMFCLSIL